MAKFTHHIFVCCNQRAPGHSRGCCDPDGKQALRDQLKAECKKRNFDCDVRVNMAGCLDQCEVGPTMVIYPQAIWYGNVKPEDIPRIIEKTLEGGEILEDLLITDEKLNSFKKK